MTAFLQWVLSPQRIPQNFIEVRVSNNPGSVPTPISFEGDSIEFAFKKQKGPSRLLALWVDGKEVEIKSQEPSFIVSATFSFHKCLEWSREKKDPWRELNPRALKMKKNWEGTQSASTEQGHNPYRMAEGLKKTKSLLKLFFN